MKIICRIFICFISFILFLEPCHAHFSLSKHNITLSENNDSDSFVVESTRDKKMRYSITLLSYIQLPNGEYKEISKTDNDCSSTNFINFSPKHFNLSPSETQVVKIKIKDNIFNKLPDGEYRVHMLVQEEKYLLSNKDIEDIRGLRDPDKKFNLEIFGFIGITTPIVIRKGNLSADAGIKRANLLTGNDRYHPTLKLELYRKGNKSVRGDLVVTLHDHKVVGSIINFAIYTENEKFFVNIPLDLTSLNKQREGELKILFRDHTDTTKTYDLSLIKFYI